MCKNDAKLGKKSNISGFEANEFPNSIELINC